MNCIYPYDSTYLEDVPGEGDQPSVRDGYNSSVEILNNTPDNTEAQNNYLSYLNLDYINPELYDRSTGSYTVVTNENIGSLPLVLV